LLGSLFSNGPLLRLRDRSGTLMEDVTSSREQPVWSGSITVLVNGATAGSAEGLASVIRSLAEGQVIGESTYGLGASVKLYEMEDGSGLLVSAALWETPSGDRWNGEGIEPDEMIRGNGADYEDRFSDQLGKALDFVEKGESGAGTEREAA
jgi:carboxyl-terminal processing protease